MSTPSERAAQAAELSAKAAKVVWNGNANDALGRTQLMLAAMFMSMSEAQQQMTLSLLASWGAS